MTPKDGRRHSQSNVQATWDCGLSKDSHPRAGGWLEPLLAHPARPVTQPIAGAALPNFNGTLKLLKCSVSKVGSSPAFVDLRLEACIPLAAFGTRLPGRPARPQQSLQVHPSALGPGLQDCPDFGDEELESLVSALPSGLLTLNLCLHPGQSRKIKADACTTEIQIGMMGDNARWGLGKISSAGTRALSAALPSALSDFTLMLGWRQSERTAAWTAGQTGKLV